MGKPFQVMESLEEIKDLLEKQGIKKNKINLSTTIQSLGFGPEEIDEFFNDFGEAFNKSSRKREMVQARNCINQNPSK